MPTYEYIENGRRVLRVLPVSERDSFPGRVTVPSRVAVCPRGPATQAQEAMDGLRKVEQQIGTGEFRRRFPFSVGQTRKAWGARRATDNFGPETD
jgi:hypothetical protein